MSKIEERHSGRSPASTVGAMMHARKVAVVGASSDPAKIGGRPVSFIKENFTGELFPINPQRSEIAGLPAKPDIASLETVPDLAIIALPAPAVEAAIADCITKNIPSIVLFSAGFGEISAEGLAAQQRIAENCAAHGVRLLGPNSIGFINFHSGLYATFSSALDNVWPEKGSVGIVSQSGAVGSYIMALAAESGVGLSHFIATGNEADVDVADCIEWLATDPQTSVIVAYLEGCKDGDRLKQALASARANRKPVIAIKPGSTDTGVAAVRSHTGMLAGSKQVFDAVLKAYGAWPAETMEEAVDLAYACSIGKYPSGSDALIITPSGGVGIMLADALDEAGFAMPPFPSGAASEIKALLPLASVANPVDTTAQVANDFRLFGKVVEIAAGKTEIPVLVVFMAHMGKTASVTELLKPVLREVAGAHPDRLIALVTRAAPDFKADMTRAGFLVFEEPKRAVAAIGALRHFVESFEKGAETPLPTKRLPTETIEAAALGGKAASRLLSEIGIPEVPVLAAGTVEDAAAAAAKVGYPVVLKIDSPDIQHKTEVGGVHLSLADEAALRNAWNQMMESVRSRAPNARIAGGLVSPMLVGGVETIIGTQNDPDFGPVVMFGLGGTMAEALKDVVFAPAPVSQDQAASLIRSIRAKALLDGWRGAAPSDQAELARAISAISAFAAAHADEVESIEVNPFVALPKGGVALDALLQLRGRTGG